MLDKVRWGGVIDTTFAWKPPPDYIAAARYHLSLHIIAPALRYPIHSSAFLSVCKSTPAECADFVDTFCGKFFFSGSINSPVQSTIW